MGAGVAVCGGRKLGAGLKLSQGYFEVATNLCGERPRPQEEAGERKKREREGEGENIGERKGKVKKRRRIQITATLVNRSFFIIINVPI